MCSEKTLMLWVWTLQRMANLVQQIKYGPALIVPGKNWRGKSSAYYSLRRAFWWKNTNQWSSETPKLSGDVFRSRCRTFMPIHSSQCFGLVLGGSIRGTINFVTTDTIVNMRFAEEDRSKTIEWIFNATADGQARYSLWIAIFCLRVRSTKSRITVMVQNVSDEHLALSLHTGVWRGLVNI